MIEVSVVPIINASQSLTPVDKLMNERLVGLASDLQTYLTKVFVGEKVYEDLVIYTSYNAKYAVQWKIVSDVSINIQAEVSKYCTNLGYLEWKEVDQHR
jgi:hypothetical protein